MTVPVELLHVVRTVADTAVAREAEFGDLDAVVGDGDFGYSLARGFEMVIAEWDSYPRTDPTAFLQKVALTISKRVGGTSGPIWGTAFLRAAAAVRDQESLGRAEVVAMLRAAVEGIQARGKAELGDKTLLDALAPLADAIEGAVGAAGADGAAVATTGARAARQAAEATSAMQARRGRASYAGERSIGSPDAGAVAVAVMAEQVAAGWPH